MSQKLYAQLVNPLLALDPFEAISKGWRGCRHARLPADMRGTADAHVKAAVPELQAAFGSFAHFLQLAECECFMTPCTSKLALAQVQSLDSSAGSIII